MGYPGKCFSSKQTHQSFIFSNNFTYSDGRADIAISLNNISIIHLLKALPIFEDMGMKLWIEKCEKALAELDDNGA
ncbi:MAG: hypothetical protein KAS67_04335 [Thermoplasmata archaeon]|nr:hypothetical protein [Thermoplasmata archaeon]